jgi:DNA-binding NarL/FixJ family response regulator
VADDQAAVIEQVIRELEPEFEIVGCVTDGQAAVEAVVRLAPDVLVLDISMPVQSGLEAARAIAGRDSKTRIVFLTIHEDLDFAQAALAVGALGYIVKSHLTTELVPAVREALAGRRFVSVIEDL